MSNSRNQTLLVLIGLTLATLSRAQSTAPYAVSTVAGSGALGDGGPATAALLEFPQAVVADASGNIYIGDYGNARIRVVNGSGTITTLTESIAVSMKIDSTGTIYATDGIAEVYKILPNGNLVTIAGSSPGYTGDNGPATAATLNGPYGVAVDTSGDVFIADYFNCVIRKITPDGMIHTIAGNGVAAFGGERVAATSSPLAYP